MLLVGDTMKVNIGISNRHVHLTKEDVEILFGHDLTKLRDLVQAGQYACHELVTIKTEKDQIENVRVLGPTRNYTQVEISKTDAYKLGLNPPIRTSGDLANSENITIANKFYEKDADEKTQQNSLIYYENIYMQNTGILYNSDKQFNVIAVLDGTVKNIKEDKILGNVIEIEHGTNLTAFYQSVDNIKVKVGDQVKQGDLIATSGANNIENTKDNCLHFQVYNQGQLLNPETFYTMNLNELS